MKNNWSSVKVLKNDCVCLIALIRNWLVVLCVCLLVLGGCIYTEEPMPRITHISVLPVPQPKVINLSVTAPDVPGEWIPTSRIERKWIAIVLHHSGTKEGNAAIFGKWHREHRHWNGVGYDFVIGNGIDSADGCVEVTYRWRKQETGAHCGGTPNNWANEKAIGICLVGDFNKTAPTDKQMQSLVKLVRFLQGRYKIPKTRIYGHRHTPGARVTECPGKHFPMAQLKSMLDF